MLEIGFTKESKSKSSTKNTTKTNTKGKVAEDRTNDQQRYQLTLFVYCLCVSVYLDLHQDMEIVDKILSKVVFGSTKMSCD